MNSRNETAMSLKLGKRKKPESDKGCHDLLNEMKSYEELNSEYMLEGFTRNTFEYLKYIINSNKCISLRMMVTENLQSTLFQELIFICKILHFNEMEVLQWSLFIDKIDWESKHRQDILLVTAFQAKVYH